MADTKDSPSTGTSSPPLSPSHIQEKPEAHQIEHALSPTTTTPRFTAAEEAAVIRKLDWHLMPLIFILYSLSVLDRSNLGNARLAGLTKDMDLSGRRYDWLATSFYISYILSQWTTIGWKAFAPHRWIAVAVFGWGLVSTLQSVCSSWAGLMVSRVFLGMFEAMYGPGVPLYLSYFYPRKKLGLRTGIFLSGSALANAYGGALAYGISQEKSRVHPWRVLFIVEGIPTCLLAVLAWFWFPDRPGDAKFLSEREREIAVAISLKQPGDRESKGLNWRQLLGALKDPRCYLPGLCYFGCNVCFASLPLFVPTIISEMGAFSTIQSNGLSAPPYLLCFFVIVGAAYASDKVGVRGPFVAGFALIASIGYMILGTATGVAPRYFGLFLSVLIFTSVAQLLIWVGNTHATDSRRAGGYAILATMGQCGPVLGTSIFPVTEKPYYRKGMWISCGACLLVFVVAIIQSVSLHLENKRRDRKYGQVSQLEAQFDVTSASGQDKRFRYVI